jgi:hypothetical protein
MLELFEWLCWSAIADYEEEEEEDNGRDKRRTEYSKEISRRSAI